METVDEIGSGQSVCSNVPALFICRSPKAGLEEGEVYVHCFSLVSSIVAVDRLLFSSFRDEATLS